MQRVDVLIVAVFVLAAAGSAIGVLTYEDDRGGSAFSVTWTTETTELGPVDTTLQGAGDAVLEIPVELQNLTSLAFEVTVAGSAARVQPVQILVTVTGPDNATYEGEGQLAAGGPGSATIPVEVTLAEVPQETSAPGASFDAAAQALAERHTSTEGQGTWTITVSVAGSAPGPIAETYSISAAGTAETYRGEVTTSAPDVSREQ